MDTSKKRRSKYTTQNRHCPTSNRPDIRISSLRTTLRSIWRPSSQNPTSATVAIGRHERIVHFSGRDITRFFPLFMGLYSPMEIPCLKSAVALVVASFAVFVSFGGVACDGSAIRLLDGRTLDDFESIPCLPKGEIAKAYSISNGMMRASGEIDALLVTRDT